VEGALTRYRVIANIVGVLLVLLTIGMFIKYLPPHNGQMVSIVGTIHGVFYMAYVVLGYDLWRRTGWPLIKMVDIALAGFIPLRTFFVERKIVRQAREHWAAQEGAVIESGAV
jgi:integral membrane protein